MDWLHGIRICPKKKQKTNPHNGKQFCRASLPFSLCTGNDWMKIEQKKEWERTSKKKKNSAAIWQPKYTLSTLYNSLHMNMYTIYTQYESMVRGMEVSVVKSTTIPVKHNTSITFGLVDVVVYSCVFCFRFWFSRLFSSVFFCFFCFSLAFRTIFVLIRSS